MTLQSNQHWQFSEQTHYVQPAKSMGCLSGGLLIAVRNRFWSILLELSDFFLAANFGKFVIICVYLPKNYLLSITYLPSNYSLWPKHVLLCVFVHIFS